MTRSLLIRGMLIGLIAGLAAFGFARWKGEPEVRHAIAFEEYVEHHDDPQAAPEHEIVSRALQDSAGLGTGAIVYGVAIGGIFSLVFVAAYGRIGLRTVRGTAAIVALASFVAIYVVPLLKYPPNPPAVGQADTIGRRTALYLLMVAVSVVGMVILFVVRRQLVPRLGAWNATVVAGVGYVVAMAICFVLLPGVNEVPQQALPGVVGAITDGGVTFPPSVLWRFRTASLGIQAIIWSIVGIGFGMIARSLLEPDGVLDRSDPRQLAGAAAH